MKRAFILQADAVTKKEIASKVADQLEITLQDSLRTIQGTFDLIIEALVKDGRIELRNFGVFEAKHRKPRKARNPKTGEAVKVPAKCVVRFAPGKVMEERVAELIKAERKKK